jgi:hypothetical protein
MRSILIYSSAAVIFFWGIGHLLPTRNVVAGFGPLTEENRRILTMEWLIEGLALCFLGALPALLAFLIGTDQRATLLVVRACAVLLLVLATVSAFTGARTSIVPMKLCPFVKTGVAAAYLLATLS